MKQRDIIIILIGLVVVQAIFVGMPFFYHVQSSYEIPQYYKIQEETNKSWPEKIFDDPVALFTLILTLFTGGLYLATRSLWTSTEKLVIGAEKTSIMQLRAYLNVSAVELTRVVDGLRPTTRVVIQNFGQTPAKNCRMWLGLVMIEEIGDFDWAPPSLNVRIVESILAPTMFSTLSLDYQFIVESEWITRMRLNIWGLYIYGEIEYRDVFNIKRTTKYRYAIGGGYGMPTDGRTVSVCEAGNEAD